MIQTRVVSYGSLNVDLSIRVPHLPAPDETLAATAMEEFLGGKGANQATAAARLGAQAAMIGCVGTDGRGDAILAGLVRNGVDHTHVTRVDQPTGTAVPLVTPEDVAIVIVRGANDVTGVEHADAAAELIAAADVLLVQGELRPEGARRAAEIARDAGTAVICNPAPPAIDVAEAVFPLASVVVVNRHEASVLPMPDPGTADVVVTLGAGGAEVAGEHIPAVPADVVDPTGAGDAFCGALAVALGEGHDLGAATRFASAAGALAVGVAGAEPSFPTRGAIDALLSSAGPPPA